MREFLEGIALGAIVFSMLIMSAKASAAGGRGIPKEYVLYCEEAGRAYGICPELLEAVIEEESGGNPDAVGAAGEIGLMQIYPKFHLERAERLGARCLFDPKGNIFVGADYLAELFSEYEDAGTALMVYNGVKDAAERGETGDYTDYARNILKRAEHLERLHGK